MTGEERIGASAPNPLMIKAAGTSLPHSRFSYGPAATFRGGLASTRLLH